MAVGQSCCGVASGCNHGTFLHRVPEDLTGIVYRDDILQLLALPALQANGQSAVLQVDNARSHRASAVNDLLQRQQVTRMDWPGRSPDLNPPEHR